MKRFGKWFKGLTDTKQALFILAVLIGLFAIGGALSPNTTKTANKEPAKSAPSKPSITTKTVTEQESIPFGSKTIESSSLPKGQSKITTAGVNGTKALTYQITYSDGQQTDKKLIKTEVTTQPVTQVTTVGTYVAPTPAPAPPSGNTYTNVDGNQVESPDGNASGSTGVCNDGSYTHALHHQGACSSHGGVSYWL